MTLEFDPEVADVLAQLGGTSAFQPPRDDVEGRRAFWEPILAASSAAQPFPDDVERSDRSATADDGAQIQMRWYTKEGGAPGPAVVYFHGGGYFFGHIDHFDGTVARYVSASGVPMLSVDYRRAPEHPFPTPVEDGYAALNWLHEHAAELGVDPERIGGLRLADAVAAVDGLGLLRAVQESSASTRSEATWCRAAVQPAGSVTTATAASGRPSAASRADASGCSTSTSYSASGRSCSARSSASGLRMTWTWRLARLLCDP